jgi:hypothetical protein
MTEKLKPRQVIKALQETKGMLYLAAKRLGVAPRTIYNYRKRYPSIDEAIESTKGEVIDMAEIRLYQAMQNSEPWAIRFILTTQAKDRGYVERQEVTGADGGPIQVDDVRDELARKMDEAIARRAKEPHSLPQPGTSPTT